MIGATLMKTPNITAYLSSVATSPGFTPRPPWPSRRPDPRAWGELQEHGEKLPWRGAAARRDSRRPAIHWQAGRRRWLLTDAPSRRRNVRGDRRAPRLLAAPGRGAEKPFRSAALAIRR